MRNWCGEKLFARPSSCGRSDFVRFVMGACSQYDCTLMDKYESYHSLLCRRHDMLSVVQTTSYVDIVDVHVQCSLQLLF